MHDFAPVFIITLNRYTHFKRCVESLAECTHAEKTDLYIALDYPLNDSHWDGYKKNANYVEEIKGFKNVVIIRRTENFGIAKNYYEAEKALFKKYDRYIFSEDDNEFSPNFLDYMNKGLNKFEEDENIMAVSGYCHPIKIPINYSGNYYLQRRFTTWGYGTWKKKWKTFYYSTEDLIHFTKKWSNAIKLYKRSQRHFKSVLSAIKDGRNFYGDMATGFFMAMNENVCFINPTISKVRNHGHDGTGEHCRNKKNDIYQMQEIDKESEFNYDDNIQNDYLIQTELTKFFGLSLKGKIKALILYIDFRLKYK